MNKRLWKDSDNDCHYFYSTDDGRIIGQVHNVVHTKIWVAKVIFNVNEEKYLGQFISIEFSKKSVEHFWDVEERTLIQQ